MKILVHWILIQSPIRSHFFSSVGFSDDMSIWDIAGAAAPRTENGHRVSYLPSSTASSSSNSDYNGLGAALLAGEQELVNPKEAKLLARISTVRVITQEDLLAEEVRDRQEATERIASDVNKIHECFTDIQSLVSQQSEAVTLIEGDIENAHSSTENGMHQIEKAARHQRQGFRCCVMALATLALTMALIAVAIVLYKKYAP